MFKKQQARVGQMMVILAVALVGVLAFTGLAVDLGRYLLAMGRLRQAADAASLAAAAQFRENRTIAEMTDAARSMVVANGFTPTAFTVNTCDTKPGDPYLCNPPRSKKVEVDVEAEMPTAFLQIIGINTLRLKAVSVGEAASMDVVLVIDTSESMTYDAAAGNPMRDPSQCNPGHRCHPFEEVRAAAKNFTSRILNLPPAKEQDRLAIVTFADGWRTGDTGPHFPAGVSGTTSLAQAWTYNYTDAVGILDSLQVFDPGWTCSADDLAGKGDELGPCRRYDGDGNYQGLDCPLFRNPSYHDPSTCTTTAIGGGLYWAAQLLSTSGRENALWIVVVLTDGAANSTLPAPGDDLRDHAHALASLPIGFCPPSTFGAPPFCRDNSVASRHVYPDPNYDADDYARDMADWLACSANPAAGCSTAGQGAAIFSIGLGPLVVKVQSPDTVPAGGALLRYIAAVGDDGDPSTDPCAGITDYTAWCGNYYYSPTGSKLDRVFEDIASRLFTRLTH
ncbi:MAG TPA: VWA domain-containing protein [Chloroflexi bacterium]|nr:VWA domain-containing protein [Chloroflexota bacterium]